MTMKALFQYQALVVTWVVDLAIVAVKVVLSKSGTGDSVSGRLGNFCYGSSSAEIGTDGIMDGKVGDSCNGSSCTEIGRQR